MKLELYKRDTCPYCVRVMKAIDNMGIADKVEMKDIQTDPENLKQLIAVGGKQQVPCLFIDGKPLYESTDIIHWLQENCAN